MKAIKATILIDSDDTETTLEHANIELKELAHLLIEIAQPKLEIAVSETQIEKFRDDAKREYIRSTVQYIGYEAYIDLYVQLKIDSYIRLEHAKHSCNEVIMAYSKKFKEMQNQIKELKNQSV